MNLKDTNLLKSELLIGGEFIKMDQTFSVLNPATMLEIAKISDGGVDQINKAIDCADQAFRTWKNESISTRQETIINWAKLIEENVDDLSTILSSENGKVITEARNEVLQCSSILKFYTECANESLNDQLISEDDNQKNIVTKNPIGVVACITPWNFPAAAVVVKVGAAVMAGCSVIIKPSDETPLIALALGELAMRAGLPSGVINIINCKNPKEIGDVICHDPRVRMLSFTGSTNVGKYLYSQAASTVKRVALELGGNAPFVIFDDADLEIALNCARGARFYNGGQICVGANRFFVHEAIMDKFSSMLSEKITGIVPGKDIGPMINSQAAARMESLTKDALSKGAKLLVGGELLEKGTLFFKPTVLSNMKPTMDAYLSEIFGPMACLYSFKDEDEVLTLANETQAGLAAYVFTNDNERATRFQRDLEAGVVGVNTTNVFSNDLPFGGIKESGLGREHGKDCLDEFLEVKSLCIRK